MKVVRDKAIARLVENLLEDVDGLEDYVEDARTNTMSSRLLTARLSRMLHVACMLRAHHEVKS